MIAIHKLLEIKSNKKEGMETSMHSVIHLKRLRGNQAWENPLNEEEKLEYQRETAVKTRSKNAVEPHLIEANSSRETNITPKKIGRPPLKDVAMTPNTLKVHKRNLVSANRKAVKISGIRKRAAGKRWQMRLVSNYGKSEEENDASESEDNGISEDATSDENDLPYSFFFI